eukprot:2680026-Alexandrium_andersonii.AAC.1
MGFREGLFFKATLNNTCCATAFAAIVYKSVLRSCCNVCVHVDTLRGSTRWGTRWRAEEGGRA